MDSDSGIFAVILSFFTLSSFQNLSVFIKLGFLCYRNDARVRLNQQMVTFLCFRLDGAKLGECRNKIFNQKNKEEKLRTRIKAIQSAHEYLTGRPFLSILSDFISL